MALRIQAAQRVREEARPVWMKVWAGQRVQEAGHPAWMKAWAGQRGQGAGYPDLMEVWAGQRVQEAEHPDWMKVWAGQRVRETERLAWMKVWEGRCDREEARRRPDPRDMDVPGRGEIGKRRKSVPGRHGRFQRRKRAGEAGRGRREPGRPKPGINGPASRLLNQRRVKARSGRMTRQGSSPLIPREKYHGAAKKGKVFPLWRSCLC